jgi:hypothetical protein
VEQHTYQPFRDLWVSRLALRVGVAGWSPAIRKSHGLLVFGK